MRESSTLQLTIDNYFNGQLTIVLMDRAACVSGDQTGRPYMGRM